MKRHPWMKWYCADWRADPRLRMCSYAARGLWADMIAYMHEAEPYGHFVVNGIVPDVAMTSALMGRPVEETQAALAELDRFKVLSRTAEGVIYSRRMVRDAEKAMVDRENGLAGGNPNIRRGSVPKEMRVRPYKRSDAPQKTQRILERAHGRCHWCNIFLETTITPGMPPPRNFFQIDFVIPICDGGTNDEDNLVAACTGCHDARRRTDNPTITIIPEVDFVEPIPICSSIVLDEGGYCRKNSDHKAQIPEARKKEGGGGDARARDHVAIEPQGEGGTISPDAFALQIKLCEVQRIDPGDPRCIGDAYQIQQWLAKGWSAEVILEAVRVVMAKRESPPGSLRYYEQAIARTHAEHARPLPIVTLEPQVFSVKQEASHGVRENRSIVAAGDRLLARIRESDRGGGSDDPRHPLLRLIP